MFERRRLGTTGLEIDVLGLGCAPLGNLYQAITEEAAAKLLASARDADFRYFDTAPHYGQGLSERRLGDALRCMRDIDYVLSTKVGRLLKPAGYASERHGFRSGMPFDIEYDYSYDGVMRSFEHSLQRLGLDRIDILLMHDIGRLTHGEDHERTFAIAMEGGYRAMDELRREGAIKAIGLGVNEFEVCEAAMKHGDWDCFLLAGRYTLLEQQSLETFLPACEQRNCSVIIGGAYNSGILATGTNSRRTLYYNYEVAPDDVVEKVRSIEAFCREYGVPLAAAALQFPLAHPAVVSVIPGLGSPRRVTQTLDLMRTTVPEEFWTSLRDAGLVRNDAPTPRA